MAVSDPIPSDSLTVRLEDLLERARNVKQSTTINPPLPVSELAQDGQPLFTPVFGDKETHMIAFEKAAKATFYNTLVCISPIRRCPPLTLLRVPY
jgi:THO complex subunit 1